MQTKVLKPTPESLALAAEILQKGGLVAFPTETVYGLGADATNAEAAKAIFAAKGRPADNPLIVHISSLSMLPEIVSSVPEAAQKLMNAFWPGPLTIIMPKGKKIPYAVTAGLETVAVSCTPGRTGDDRALWAAHRRAQRQPFRQAQPHDCRACL